MKNLLMTIFSILGLATISFGQTLPSYIPSNGLVGWWPFNGNANDESGNGNNGTVNGTILTTDRFGIVNKAFYFNGSTDIITVPNSGTISLGGTNQLSVQAWAKKSGNQSTMHILGKRINGCGSIEYQFGYCELGCQLANIEGIGFGGMPGSYVLSGAAIDTVNWHHFVGTFNGQTWKLYLNSILIDSVNNSTTNPNVGDLIFGSSGTCPNWQGSIDDIGIWNRALNEEEVTSLFYGSSVRINEISQSNLFSVFPNPAQSEINVNIDAKLVGSVFTIYDNIGKAVKTGKLNSVNTTIELNDLSSGIYTFSVGENKKQTFKVVKE